MPGARKVHGIELDIHTLLYAVVAALVGFQTVLFAVLAKVFAITAGLLPKDPQLKKLFRIFTLEVGLGVGVLLLIAGIACALYSTFLWKASGFGAMDPSSLMRSVACAAALTLLGVQGTLSSLFFSILGLAAGRNEASEALQSQKASSARKCSCAPKDTVGQRRKWGPRCLAQRPSQSSFCNRHDHLVHCAGRAAQRTRG